MAITITDTNGTFIGTYGEVLGSTVYADYSAPPVTSTSMTAGQRLFQLRKLYGSKLGKPIPVGNWEGVFPVNKHGWEIYSQENPGLWELWCYENKIWNCSYPNWLALTNGGDMDVDVPPPIAKPTRKIRCLNRPGEMREIV